MPAISLFDFIYLSKWYFKKNAKGMDECDARFVLKRLQRCQKEKDGGFAGGSG